MIVVKVEVEATGIVGKDNSCAGTFFTTQINLSWEEAQKYYAVGKIINMGFWHDKHGHEREDDMMRIASCTLVSGN